MCGLCLIFSINTLSDSVPILAMPHRQGSGQSMISGSNHRAPALAFLGVSTLTPPVFSRPTSPADVCYLHQGAMVTGMTCMHPSCIMSVFPSASSSSRSPVPNHEEGQCGVKWDERDQPILSRPIMRSNTEDALPKGARKATNFGGHSVRLRISRRRRLWGRGTCGCGRLRAVRLQLRLG
ncbi:hypothetical protein FA13DRAFT_60234 [Coprinellus micaceus]|uniref:Uncharacterized protein n=1 Tax=Coprinellus micaceus TaxID=71717 RepID=A0A4Y7U1D0_COPMI|nr:hypothetical protein FA13DRAFT_60234 [Coprinellus micaceus]